MKKLILTTSALVLMGGAAAAQDISISAEASVSYGNWETAAGTAATFDFGTELTFGLEGTSGAYTYGAELTLEDGAAVGHGVIWVSGGFGKVSFGVDEFDELNADDLAAALDVNGVVPDEDYGDVKYEGEFGAVSVTVVADAEMGHTPTGGATVAATNAAWVAILGYDAGSFNLGLETDSTNAWELSAGFDAGNFTVDASFDDTNAWDLALGTSFGGVNVTFTADDAQVYGIELDGTAGDISWAVATNTDSETSASVDYAMGDLSVGLAYDNDDAGFAGVADRGDEADFILTVGYAMDNLAFELLYNDVNEYEISMTAGFTF